MANVLDEIAPNVPKSGLSQPEMTTAQVVLELGASFFRFQNPYHMPKTYRAL
jgi:hypothetical protein